MSEELNKAILTALAQHTSYLYRVASAEVNSEVKAFDSIMNAKIERLATVLRNLNAAERDAMAAGQYNTDRLKRLKEILGEWQGDLNTQLYSSFEESAIALATHESEYVAKISGESAAMAISGEKIYKASKRVSVAREGEFLYGLFRRFSIESTQLVKANIITGLKEGWTNDQILRSITGSEDVPSEPSIARTRRINLESTIRTGRMHVSNTSYIETYQAIGYTHVKVVATLDGRTCKVCAKLDGEVYPIDGTYPSFPQHPNSRTILVGCDADGKLIGRRPYVMDDKSVAKIPKDERDAKIGQVNANTDYQHWFNDSTEDFKRTWLGKTRYDLYKDGGYSIDRFVDPTNKEYTIAQLRELDKKTFKELGL